jgi:hypothetical protein
MVLEITYLANFYPSVYNWEFLCTFATVTPKNKTICISQILFMT